MRKLLAVISLMALMLFTTASAALAFDVREKTNGHLIVAKDEVVHDDMLLAGSSVVIDGTINGDVMAFADTVVINGTINGTLITAGSKVDIKGAVNGAVLAAGETVTVEGAIQRSLISAASRSVIYESANIGGSWLGAGDRLEHRGTVTRGAAVGAADLFIKGKIGKELKAGVDTLTFAGGASVGGPVEYWSENEARVESGAVTGQLTRYAPDQDWQQVTRPWFLRPGWIALKFGGFMALGLLLLAVFPGARSRFPQTLLANPWQAPLAGFLALVATPIAAIILMVTIVGLPIGLSALLLFPLMIYISQIFVSWSVARLLADHIPGLEGQSWPVLFLLGAIITTALVEMPWMGSLFAAAFLFYGLGGLVYLMIKRGQPA